MRLLTTIFALLIAGASLAQAPIIRNAPGDSALGLLATSTTLRPHITCPGIDTGYVWWWKMFDGPMGSGAYWHSMSATTDGTYWLGVDDSQVLQPGEGYCFLCTEGPDYNTIDFDNLPDSFGIVTPDPSCEIAPEFSISGEVFSYDEPYAEALGERWSVKRSANVTGAAPYSYKTPRHSPYLFDTANDRVWWFVTFTLASGEQCHDTVNVPALRRSIRTEELLRLNYRAW